MKNVPRLLVWAFLLLGLLLSVLSPQPSAAQPTLEPPPPTSSLPVDADPQDSPNLVRLHRQDPQRANDETGDPLINPLINARPEPDATTMDAQGERLVRTLVHLDQPPLATVTTTLTPEQRRTYAAEIALAQEAVVAQIEAEGGVVVGRLTLLSSGILANIPAASASRLVAMPQVERISLIHDYQVDLSESVPAIGASTLHTLGVTGDGIVIAVIDSGVDFTHRAFCPSGGTIADFTAAYALNDQAPVHPCFGPGAKVIGGHDWVGEEWPSGPLAADPNPIDIQGHGTHVADIAAGLGYGAGVNADGPYPAKGAGVAPGAALWALKACSANSGSCSGEAILLALEDAADMDNDLGTVDPVDIVNMSLGSKYGQPEDDAIAFVNALAQLGVFVAISAGNEGDIPFIVGQPSIADGAISVAQSSVPSYGRYPLQVLAPASISGYLTSGVWQRWSVDPQISGTITGPLIYGNGDGSNTLGCDAFSVPLTGRVVLLDRGDCDFTLKAANASIAGASIALIAMTDDDAPFEGSDAFHRPISMPVFMLSLAEANLLRAGLAEVAGVSDVLIKLDPALFVPLPKTMVDTSARGPASNDNRLKPEIAAPGAAVSARAGNGSASVPFGGTSGAAPMVAGAAALLLEQHGGSGALAPFEVKALLMNNTDTDIHLVDPLTGEEADLAPIARMGSGQLAVAAAYSATLMAWDSNEGDDPLRWSGALSFGYVAVSANTLITRTMTLQNLQNVAVDVELAATFRYANDENHGVQITPQPSALTLPANGTAEVEIVLSLYPQGMQGVLGPLKPWQLDKGEHGNDGALFSDQEVDGFIVITPTSILSASAIHLPWHLLPKAAAGMVTETLPTVGALAGAGTLLNQSLLVTGKTRVFDLLEQNANDYHFTVGDCASVGAPPGCNLTVVDLRDVGVRSFVENSELMLEFAFTLWDKPFRAAQIPVEFRIFVDSNGDFEDDYTIYNADVDYLGEALDGRNAVFVFDHETLAETPYFFTDSDFNTQNYILRVPAAAVGVTAGEQFGFGVEVAEIYFNNSVWDCSPFDGFSCGGFHFYTPGQPAYAVPEAQRVLTTTPGTSSQYSYQWSVANANASPSQIGLLFMHDLATVGRESDSLRLTPPEGKLAVSKQASVNTANVGDSITYQVRITNTGALTVANVAAFDSLLGNLTLGTTTLGPGAFTTASLPYTVQEIDLPGPLVSTVTATGQPLAGDSLEAQASTTVTLNMPSLGLAVSKIASPSSILLGEEVTYHFFITNTGELALSDLFAVDDKLGLLDLGTTTLAAGQSIAASASTIPQLSDLPGPLVNLVTVNGTPSVGNLVQATATASVALAQPAVGLTVVKPASVTTATLASLITYRYEIANVGETALSELSVHDDKIGALPLESTLLLPAQVISLTASYSVTEADFPGPLVNIVTVSAIPIIGSAITVTEQASVALELEPVDAEYGVILPIIRKGK